MQVSRILKNVLERISPTKAEIDAEKRFAEESMNKLGNHVPDGAHVMLMGSVAKGTFLRGNMDVDIFILLPKTVRQDEFEGIAKRAAVGAFPDARLVIRYSQHPYVSIYAKFEEEERKLDIVPAYEIKTASERVTAVDRTTLHVKYIYKNLKRSAIPDVRLLKKFLRAAGAYGAEIRVEGFSGYLCELLIIKYGNFMRFLREAAKWKTPAHGGSGKSILIIDLAKHYPLELYPRLIEKFKDSRMIVIDPTDKNRNVAAIVSRESIRRISLAARAFIKAPTEKSFFRTEDEIITEKMNSLNKRSGKTYAIVFPAPRVTEDVLWGQLKRMAKDLVNYLEKNDFEASGIIADADEKEAKIYIGVKTETLDKIRLMPGPPVKKEFAKNLDEFKKAHPKARIVIKKRKAFAEVKRSLRNANDAILMFFKTRVLPSHFIEKRGMIKIKNGNMGKK